MLSVRVFHGETATVPTKHVLAFMIQLLSGTSDVVLADLRCLVEWYHFSSSHWISRCITMNNFEYR